MLRGRSPLWGALAVTAVVAGCNGGEVAPSTTTVTQTATGSASPTTATPSTPTSAPAVSSAPAEETFRMPKLVGANLQDAQDLLQKRGSYLLDQEDARGLDRFQVLDSNWKVCTQRPKAGRTVPVTTVVRLSAVKLTETCP